MADLSVNGKPLDVELGEAIGECIQARGLDGFLRLARLVCDMRVREIESTPSKADPAQEEARDRWRARARFLAGLVMMAERVEGFARDE